MFQNILILLKPLISWARGRLSKDDVCAVQKPGSLKTWLLSSLVLCLCFPHSLSSSTLPGRVGCYRRGFWTAPLPAGPSPVLSLQTWHTQQPRGWGPASQTPRGEQPLCPPACPPQTAQLALKQDFKNQPAALANAPTRKSLLWHAWREGTGYLATADWPAFLTASASLVPLSPRPVAPLHLASALQLPPSRQQPSCLLLRLQAFNTAQAHSLSKTALGALSALLTLYPACLPKRKKGSWFK